MNARPYPVTAPEYLGVAQRASRKQYLSKPSADDLCAADCFLSIATPNGEPLAGGYVLGDELGGLFSLRPGYGAPMVGWLISRGARRLNCYGDGLRDYYRRFGFVVVYRAAFCSDLAPADWDPTTQGTPPYYEMRIAL